MNVVYWVWFSVTILGRNVAAFAGSIVLRHVGHTDAETNTAAS